VTANEKVHLLAERHIFLRITMRIRFFTFVRALLCGDPMRYLFQYDGVHTENWAFLGLSWKKLFASHCTGHDVAHQWITLRKICCEVHLFPAGTNKEYYYEYFSKNRRLPFIALFDP